MDTSRNLTNGTEGTQVSAVMISAHELEKLKSELAAEKAARAEANKKVLRDEDTIAKLRAAVFAKADTTTRLGAAALALFAHEQADQGNYICADSIATQDAFAKWLGVSKNTAGDVQKQLAAVGVIRKTQTKTVRNRHGEVLDTGYADASMGSYYVTQVEMDIMPQTAEERAQALSVASFYKKSTNKETAKEHQKEQRRLAKIGKEIEKMACPNCKGEGIGHLHVHCDNCGWDSTMPMPDDHTDNKPKKGRRAKPPTEAEVRMAIANGEHEPPCPSDLDQLPDERRTAMERARTVRGRHSTEAKRYDIHEEEPGVTITLGQNLNSGVIEAKSNFDPPPDSLDWAVREIESIRGQSQIL